MHAYLAVLSILSIMAPPAPPDLVLYNAQVVTPAGAARALAIRDERIVYVGDDAGARRLGGKAQLDLDGAAVVPGLSDAHAHLASLGAELDDLDLRGTHSARELLARVASVLPKATPGRWLIGRGWDQNDWPDQAFPDRTALDALVASTAPGTPVYLRRIDGHAVLVNERVLTLAGIDANTKDPPGGRIVRDRNGRATGVLVDAAMERASALRPRPTAADIERHVLAAEARALAVGLTAVHDMGTTRQELAVYRALDAAGRLSLRVYAALDGSDAALLDEEYAHGPSLPAPGKKLTVRAVKLYADGALGSRGAALLADYSDDPGNHGLLTITQAALVSAAERARAHGYQVCVHAIGDAANRLVLEAFAHVAQANDNLRFRVEHAQVVDPADWSRFAALGVIASMQPTHATSDMDWAEARLGPKRSRGAYAWRSLLAAGARLAFGSDFPVERPDPLLGLVAAVTRGGWRMDEALSREQALAGFTRGAAYAAFEERSRGAIAVGMLADLTVLSRNPLSVSAAELAAMRVLGTYVGGVRR